MEPSGSAVPSQGNSGAVGSMQYNANDLRSADNNPIAELSYGILINNKSLLEI